MATQEGFAVASREQQDAADQRKHTDAPIATSKPVSVPVYRCFKMTQRHAQAPACRLRGGGYTVAM